MSRRLLVALLTATQAAAWIAAVPTSAHAHYRPLHQACVTAKYRTWLYRCHGCREPVYRGRAFRVDGQAGGQLRVRNGEMWGWVHLRAMDLADEDYCRAAGI